MTRLTSIAAVAALSFATPAFAQSQADVAHKLNEEGKELMYAAKYAEASAKFREAVARVPEPKYFFNLCTSRFQEGKFDEAMTACMAVEKNNPTADQRAKSEKLMGRIRDEAKAQGITLNPGGGGGGDTNLPDPNQPPPDPNQPPPDVNSPGNPTGPTLNPAYTPAVGRPPSQGLFVATAPENKYTWTVGLDLFFGGGKLGREDYYGTATTGFRIKGDYMLNAAQKFGAQVYFQFTQFGEGDGDFALVDNLDVFDVGLAAYKHLCGSQARFCLTPLVGLQLALMSPANESDGRGSQVFNYAAAGLRAEIGAQYGIGKRREHQLGVVLGLNAYSPVFSGPADDPLDDMLSINEVGLDKGGAAAYFGIGYTYRFNTPIGSSPFVTLE